MMSLSNAKALFDHLYERSRDPDNTRLVVKIEAPGTVGGTPCANVSNISLGSDWDQGKIIISTDDLLHRVEADEIEHLREELRKIGWTAYEFNNLKRENKRLRKLLDER